MSGSRGGDLIRKQFIHMVTFLLNSPFVQGSIILNEIFRLNDEIYETSTFLLRAGGRGE